MLRTVFKTIANAVVNFWLLMFNRQFLSLLACFKAAEITRNPRGSKPTKMKLPASTSALTNRLLVDLGSLERYGLTTRRSEGVDTKQYDQYFKLTSMLLVVRDFVLTWQVLENTATPEKAWAAIRHHIPTLVDCSPAEALQVYSKLDSSLYEKEAHEILSLRKGNVAAQAADVAILYLNSSESETDPPENRTPAFNGLVNRLMVDVRKVLEHIKGVPYTFLLSDNLSEDTKKDILSYQCQVVNRTILNNQEYLLWVRLVAYMVTYPSHLGGGWLLRMGTGEKAWDELKSLATSDNNKFGCYSTYEKLNALITLAH